MRFGRPGRSLTLRARLALWTAAAAFVCSAGLALFINSTTVLVLRSVKAPPPRGIPAETWQVVNQIRLDSVLGLGLVAAICWTASYWFAGHALRPLRQVSQAAVAIDTGTLGRRLAFQGPCDELKELADRFDAMLDRLQVAFAREHEFVADVSHELRTPLAVSRANLEMAHLDPFSTVHDYREMADTLEAALARLERLASDLLILASDEVSLTRETVFLAPLIEDILVDLRPVADGQGIKISYGSNEQLIVHGDPQLLTRAFQNLIENAIHYNHPDGTVGIHLRQHEAGAAIEIADTGIGIRPEDLPYIFERFYRVDRSRSRHRGGAGLGLALVREVVRRYGGDIRVESRPDIGTSFTVLLPV
ncbi:MAG: sensor histidine kinase [Chloroflexota bacterium]|nr:MAG: hypothetical protein DLM70_10575 [Chloroflexota bacterium]